MATIHDATNDVSHAIEPNKPLIIGRGTPQFNLTHPNVSRKQGEIYSSFFFIIRRHFELSTL